MSKITILGIGANGIDSLNKQGVEALHNCDVVFGGTRHLNMVTTVAEKIVWVSPFKDNIATIKKYFDTNKKILIIATGDVNWFGVNTIIRKHFDNKNITIINNVGCISLSAIKMGWALQDITALSIHGRSVNTIINHIYNTAKIVLLSNDKNSPLQVCEILQKLNFGESEVTILNDLGADSESVQSFNATAPQTATSDLNCIAIQCKGHSTSLTGGLNDENFINDGQLTKREVRAITMSSLQPSPNAILWDIGAGSGSISVEWCRLGGLSYAFETNANRIENIKQNCSNLGVAGKVNINNCSIDEFNQDLPQPDCIFIGGGITTLNTDKLYNQLKPNGRLVINSVSIQGFAIINKLYQKYGGDIIRISIERNHKIGSFDTLKPMASVVHFCTTKD